MVTKVGRKVKNRDLKDSDIREASLSYLVTPVGDTIVLTELDGSQTYIYLSDEDRAYINTRSGLLPGAVNGNDS